jgi:hypothetical protein
MRAQASQGLRMAGPRWAEVRSRASIGFRFLIDLARDDLGRLPSFAGHKRGGARRIAGAGMLHFRVVRLTFHCNVPTFAMGRRVVFYGLLRSLATAYHKRLPLTTSLDGRFLSNWPVLRSTL